MIAILFTVITPNRRELWVFTAVSAASYVAGWLAVAEWLDLRMGISYGYINISRSIMLIASVLAGIIVAGALVGVAARWLFNVYSNRAIAVALWSCPVLGVAASVPNWFTAGSLWGDPLSPSILGGVIVIMMGGAMAGTVAQRQFGAAPIAAIGVAWWSAIAIAISAVAFVWGFWANFGFAIFWWSESATLAEPDSHLQAIVFTLIAGGVLPVVAAGTARVAGIVAVKVGG